MAISDMVIGHARVYSRAYGYPYAYPAYGYRTHLLHKRSADAEAEAEPAYGYRSYGYRHYAPYARGYGRYYGRYYG